MDGNKIVLFIKSVSTATGIVWSFIVGAMGWAFPTLVLFMFADFVSGVSAGAVNEGMSSRRGRIGFVKKVHILIIVGAVYLIERSIFHTQHVGDGVTISYIIIEFISLTENAGRLGVPLGPVKKFIEILKEKGDVQS